MQRVDANIILRYLLEDHPDFSEKAAAIMETETVMISFEVVCEVVYVLSGVYGADRDTIAEKLSELMRFNNVETSDADVLLCAFRIFKNDKVDFVDAVLCAYHRMRGDQIQTFDKRLLRLLDEPPESNA